MESSKNWINLLELEQLARPTLKAMVRCTGTDSANLAGHATE